MADSACASPWCHATRWPDKNYSPDSFPSEFGVYCFGCAWWHQRAADDLAGAVVAERTPGRRERFWFDPAMPVKDGSAGLRGFGGHRWLVRFADGREVVTNDLWHNGVIPAEFLDLFPVNAVLLSEYAAFKEASDA